MNSDNQHRPVYFERLVFSREETNRESVDSLVSNNGFNVNGDVS
jgi:hypothetical protein